MLLFGRDLHSCRLTLLAGSLLLSTAVAAQQPSDLDRGRQLHRAGDFAGARSAYVRVLADHTASLDDQAAAGSNLSLLLLATGDPAKAVEIGRRAVQLRRRQNDQNRLARTLNNLGLALQRTGALDQARDAFDEALELNLELDNSTAAALNLGNLAALEIDAGRYEAALDRLDRADSITADRRDPTQVAMTQLNRGVVLERLGEHHGAFEQLQLSAESGALPPDQLATLEINRGVVLRHLGDPVKAIAAFERARASFQGSEDPAGTANAELNIALALHRDLEDFDRADTAYRRSLSLALEAGDRTQQVAALSYFGDFLADRGQLEEAEFHYQECLEIAKDVGIAEGRWSALAGLGRIAEQRSNLELAAVFLRLALTEIEALHNNLSNRSLRSSYLREQRPVYEATVRAFVALADSTGDPDWLDRAFEVVQRAKARELSEALGVSQGSSPTLDQMQARLGDRTLVSYFVAGDQLLRFALDPDQFTVSTQDNWREIRNAIESVRSNSSRLSNIPPESLAFLSRALLADLELSESRDLVVAPDSTLHGLPFELLRPEAGFALVDSRAVTYVPAASFLARDDRAPVGTTGRTLAFANPELSDHESSLQRRFFADLSLPPLPRAHQELASIRSNFDGPHDHFEGRAATESTLRRTVTQPTSILHLATHAVRNEERRRRTAVVLGASEEHDGLLFPGEIANLEIATDLTVLAACHSASDLGSSAGAYTSLVGAFLMAGSSSVVATLWNVDDADSSVFMEQFYYHLGRGLLPAAAMREAKLRLKEDPQWNNPGIWAAFVVIGSPATIQTSRVLEIGLGIAFCAALVGVTLSFSRRRATT